MTVLMENTAYSITELEIEGITNYLARESFDIINEELDYYTANQEKLLKLYVNGINFTDLNTRILQEWVNTIIYNSDDIEACIRRIHKRIEKEFNRAQYQITFDLKKNTAANIVKADISPYLRENIKTYNLSNAICKGIDMTWKKSSSKIIPKTLNIFVSRFSMGEHVLGAVGLSPKEFKEKIRKKILNVMTGILRQYKTELKNILKQEIIQHLLNCNHDDIETNNICKLNIKSA
ncbi:MAG: hypothetical protein KGZ94_02535 [Clostridia bacterium]|nr:hypothetical protein [Clostridia bacterium]